IRMDGATEKRVELHLHTQMSALDAVTPVSEYVKRAALWGHKAMAVTDHGVIQAFPEAAEAAAKYGVKVIYGVECYLCEDAGSVVMKPAGQSLETDYVVFDLETTGLDPDKDRIIELGAVKVSGGVITEGYGTYVDPGIPVPEKITGLTGIDDDKVRGAPPVEEVVKGLAAFAGDAVLVAHNAPFDMGFIGKAAASAGIKISNTVLDTLQLSRALYPEMKSHRLNVLASYFNISLPNHHRAEDDCRATAGIMLKLLEKLKEQGIEDLDKAGGLKPDNHFAARNDSWHAIILVRNRTGLRNLYKLISISHLDYFYKKPRMPRKIVSELREGLILGTACEAGELFRAIATGKDERRINEIADFYDYYEIQPTGNNMFLTGEESPETGADEYGHSIKTVEDIQNINRRIYELGRKKGKPVAATGDVHFLDPQDEYFRRIIMAGQGYEDADRQPPLYFKTTGEMLEEFSYLGEAAAREVVVVNTAAIANMVDDGLRPIPEGSFTPSIEGAEAEVEKLALANARAIYGDPLPELVDTRLRRELDSVITHGFAIMYLIAEKLVSKSMSDGYTVCSRGSVGSSFLATMCGITEVNPLTPHYVCPSCRFSEFHEDGQYGSGFDMPPRDCPRCGTLMRRDGQDIPFETFLGFHGEKTPDIDLNFSGEYQIKAHKYVEELFGPGHTFKAGTIGTIRDKTAYGFVKKYLESKGMTVTNAEMKRLIKGCTGIRRTTGQHPGGIVVIPEEYEIYDFSPVQHPADNTDSDVVTTHFDFTSLHDTILKFDILGHDDPTMIRELEDTTGVRVQDIPIPDEKVMRLFKDAGPLDVDNAVYDCDLGVIALPELGTKMSRAMVREARPETFLDLIQIMGLSHGTDVWIGNARELIRNGTCTISEVIGTRDSIMTGLIRYGLASDEAFQITESVRKGRGLTEKQEEIMREHRVPEWYIDSCKKIKYMFPKAHAAAYAISALRMGWFKIYYPKEFYAAYYTVRRNEFSFELMCRGVEVIKKNMKEIEQKGKEATDKENNTYKMLEIVLEMYARGIGFVPADVYKSDAFKFRITPEGIRPPLVSLQGLGESAAQNIARLREEGRFNSVEDLCIKARISKSVADTLRQNGCLEGIPETSQLTLF
ncbi:MAG: PolC-type DNA polymerase III, partial [Eubacteriales bacterium]|nr:PolC-type DNA polymerase III [Eubacteriales bacterium]